MKSNITPTLGRQNNNSTPDQNQVIFPHPRLNGNFLVGIQQWRQIDFPGAGILQVAALLQAMPLSAQTEKWFSLETEDEAGLHWRPPLL